MGDRRVLTGPSASTRFRGDKPCTQSHQTGEGQDGHQCCPSRSLLKKLQEREQKNVPPPYEIDGSLIRAVYPDRF